MNPIKNFKEIELLNEATLTSSSYYDYYRIRQNFNMTSQNDQIINFFKNSSEVTIGKKILISDRNLNNYNKPNQIKTREWWDSEDKQLIALVRDSKTRNWKRISEIIKTKTAQQCTYRYNKLIREMNSRVWNRQEDIKLIEMIEAFGHNWTLISEKFEGRSPKEIEYRFFKKLDPNLKNPIFCKEEDYLLTILHNKYGNKWVYISKFFANYEPETIKRRFYSLIKSNKEEYIKNNSYNQKSSSLFTNQNLNSDRNINKETIFLQENQKLQINKTIVNYKESKIYDKIDSKNKIQNNLEEFKEVFKNKKTFLIIENSNMGNMDIDLSNYKKSDSFSTNEVTEKSEFNVDSFFQDSDQSSIGDIKNINDLENLSMKLTNFLKDGIINDKFTDYKLNQLDNFEEYYQKILSLYNSKELEFAECFNLNLLSHKKSNENIMQLNNHLNTIKEYFLNHTELLKQSNFSSNSDNKINNNLIFKKIDILFQVINLTKLKINLIKDFN